MATIPSWTAQGVLPPVDVLSPTDPNRSPYKVSLTDVILHFSTSPERCTILDGFLRHRAGLHTAGLTTGFQWLNGSFLEQIEMLESRNPRDIDVVTFFALPQNTTQDQLLQAHRSLFDPRSAKVQFHVDPYFVDLGLPSFTLVRQSAYWYSLWSHRRSWTWKGYLEVELSPGEDTDARALLLQAQTEGGQP